MNLNFKMKIILFIFLFICKTTYSITIDDSVKSTIENNPKVKIALEKLEESKEIIENAVGQKLPNITSTISGTYSNSDKNSITGQTTPETFTDKYKLSITQNLFDSGFNNLEIERSKILYENEIINFKKTIQDLALNAIEGYLTVINYEKSLDASQKNFDSVSQFLEETKTRYNLDVATLYELQNSQSAHAIAETNLFIANQNYEMSKKTFKRISGIPALNLEEIIKIDDELDLDKILNNVSINNYDIIILQNDIKNKQFLLKKEKNSKKPSIDLSASAEYSDSGRIDDGTETTNGSIGLTLTIPIFKQNLDNSNIRKYNSQILQAELNLLDYKDELNIVVSNLYKDYLISKSKISSNLVRIKSIETSLESIIEEYNIGTKTTIDIIDAESELLEFYVSYFTYKKEYILNYFNIMALQGSIVDIFKNYLPEYY